jgi:hypothetical protein
MRPPPNNESPGSASEGSDPVQEPADGRADQGRGERNRSLWRFRIAVGLPAKRQTGYTAVTLV